LNFFLDIFFQKTYLIIFESNFKLVLALDLFDNAGGRDRDGVYPILILHLVLILFKKCFDFFFPLPFALDQHIHKIHLAVD
jgi:hypothetical protein